MIRVLQLLRNIGEAAFVVDDQQRILLWNSVASELFGYTAEEAEGNHCWRLLQGRTSGGKPLCYAGCGVLTRVQEGGPVAHFNARMAHSRGWDVDVNISTLPFPPTEETPAAMIHLLRERNRDADGTRVLHVAMLGPLEVRRADGALVNGPGWRRTKVRALFACLTLARGRVVPREKLLELLWPEMDHAAALHNLNTTVYSLRRTLEPELDQPSSSHYVLYEGGNYRLEGADTFWIDIDEFEQLIRRARWADDPERAISLYQAAHDLYRGNYLADLVDTGVWHCGQSARLAELYLTSLEELGHLYETRSQPQKAEEAYLRALSVDPCCESACQKLMKLLLRQGDRAAAAVHCRRLLENLQAHLDMDTSPETQALCHEARCDT